MSDVRVVGLSKSYGKVRVVEDLSLHVQSGEFITILGPSGCGKTTTLRCVAGLEHHDKGEIFIGDRRVSGPGHLVPPEQRDVGMIFQSYAVWPHLTVFENVAFGLRLRKMPEPQIAERVAETLAMVGMTGLDKRNATDLSGGQQQRVAVARSLAFRPKVLLFDEPLSNLDAKLRERMRLELRELQAKLGITSIYVTHDQTEAMAISDRIIVMHQGEILQEGPPTAIYQRPATPFLADFIGVINFLQGRVTAVGEGLTRADAQGSLPVHFTGGEQLPHQSEVTLGIRPEHVRLTRAATGAAVNTWPADVCQIIYMGEIVEVHVESAGVPMRIRLRPLEISGIEVGKGCFITVDPEQVLCWPVKAKAAG